MYEVDWSNGVESSTRIYATTKESAERERDALVAEVARQGAYDGIDVSTVKISIYTNDGTGQRVLISEAGPGVDG